MATDKVQTIDAYMAGLPEETARKLEQIRKTIREVVPDAQEMISYQIPAFKRNGRYLIYFAGWKKHIALYPVSGEMVAGLKDELANYKGSKGSVHFPLDKEMPLDLVRKIIEWKLKE
ncbi:iron chaperone [Dyadobacter sp.]|uniref:iron chaperone n=1 Tax=Dyadobacter sp. TaxID=1914288 RepID=UPI003F71D737